MKRRGRFDPNQCLAPSLTNLAHQLLIGAASLSTTCFTITVMVHTSSTDAEDRHNHGGAPMPSSPPVAAINVVAPPVVEDHSAH